MLLKIKKKKKKRKNEYERGLASILYKFFDKIFTLLVVVLKVKLCQTSTCQKNYTNQLLENLRNEKYINLLKTIFGVLILKICS